MTTRREILVALGAGALAIPLASRGQQRTAKMHRIGYLSPTSARTTTINLEGFRVGLRELGYVEGTNLVIEYRYAEGKYERLPELVAELVRIRVDVIVTGGTPAAQAAKTATTTIPIVMAIIGDPVADGIVKSLARPGGNITGSTFFNPELAAKRVEFLKEILPQAKRVAVLMNPDNPNEMTNVRAIEVTAASRQLELQVFGIRKSGDVESALPLMAKSRYDAVLTSDDAVLVANIGAIARLAEKLRLPAFGFPELAEAGGLMGYGMNRLEMYRRAAYLVDKVLKGTNPGDIPIERATRFSTLVNMRTAKALGITIPPSILILADKVIE